MVRLKCLRKYLVNSCVGFSVVCLKMLVFCFSMVVSWFVVFW